jgi:hypothetical protein
MNGTRPVRTRWLVLLPLVSGLVTGLLAGRLWAREIETQARRAHRAAAARVQQVYRSDEWRRDSIRWDSIRRRSPPGSAPREVARLQLHRDCAVTFEFSDASYFQVFDSDAWGHGREWLGRAVAFSPTGFAAGDEVTVVFTDVECMNISSLSRGGGIGPAQVDSLIRRQRLQHERSPG